MPDEQSPHDSELTPEQESAVRRLLAEARHDEGIPDTVADRLDRVLVQLRDEPLGASAPVVELAARRRRRNAGRLLMAAAAIVVGGAVVGQFVGTAGDDFGASDSADSAGSAEAPNARTTGPGAESFSSQGDDDDQAYDGQEAGPEEAAPGAGSPADGLVGGLPVRLSRQNFDEDVRGLAAGRDLALDELATQADKSRNLLSNVPSFDCPPAAYGRGALVPAYYDDQPAVLAFRPPTGSNQVAELLRCGTAETLRSVTIPRR